MIKVGKEIIIVVADTATYKLSSLLISKGYTTYDCMDFF